jgi:phosphoserine phosphatase
VLDRKKLNERLHEETVELLARVRSLGIEPFVVSASPLVVVEAAAAHARIGIDRDHVVAATPLLVDGTVTTELDRPIPYGPGKVTRLRERIGGRPFVLAAGDNIFDLAMLTESSVPVAIRPKARLVARAQELPRLVTLARVD